MGRKRGFGKKKKQTCPPDFTWRLRSFEKKYHSRFSSALNFCPPCVSEFDRWRLMRRRFAPGHVCHRARMRRRSVLPEQQEGKGEKE